jgi:hypothetical protein
MKTEEAVADSIGSKRSPGPPQGRQPTHSRRPELICYFIEATHILLEGGANYASRKISLSVVTVQTMLIH